MEEQRSGKRTSRACEPCRRKKVKCSGERPLCSFCRRLGQDCEYRGDGEVGQHPILEHRMESIEEKLDQLLNLNRSHSAIPRPHHAPGASPVGPESMSSCEAPPAPMEVAFQPIESQASASTSLYPDLYAVGALYQTWCHNQPLYLFRQEGFLESLQHRDREVCLAIQALVSRFPPSTLTAEKQHALLAIVASCRRLVIERISSGNIKLSTLQALCLLSLISFGDGNTMQAGLDLSTAHYFASELPSGSSLGDPLECSLCIHSISLLQYIQERVAEGFGPGQAGTLPRHPTSMNSNINWSSRFPLLREPGRELDPGLGILSYVAQAAEVWQMARAYAVSTVGPDELPPWDPRSDYSLIMLRLLELDSAFPLRYRFARSKFSELDTDTLQKRRDYWGPWFFIQIVHSTIPTLVNHPFLLSMRLKNFRRLMPQTFIHQSFDQIARHTAWVICFIDLVEKQDFQLSDPIIAHCVTIIATIHLQHSFVRDDAIRQKAQNGYEKCTRFLGRMSTMWPTAASMAENLLNLRNSITTVSSGATHEQQALEPGGSWSIDAQLLWDLLIYEKAGRKNATADRSMFGEAISLDAHHREQDIAEYAMIGSTGISGHKTVPREVSAYAPRENEPFSQPGGSATSSLMIGDDLDPGYNQFTQGYQDSNQMTDYLLQPGDFGKVFHDWLNLDVN